MLQDADYINDASVKIPFVRKVREHMAVLRQKLDNPITRTQTFVKVLNNINNNGDVGDADVFPGTESLYWIFVHKDTDDQQTKRKKEDIRRDANYLVNRLWEDIKIMNLEDILVTLDFTIQDFSDHKRTTVREDFKDACTMIINQASDLRQQVSKYFHQHKEASKAAEDNLELPDDVIGIINTMNSLRF